MTQLNEDAKPLAGLNDPRVQKEIPFLYKMAYKITNFSKGLTLVGGLLGAAGANYGAYKLIEYGLERDTANKIENAKTWAAGNNGLVPSDKQHRMITYLEAVDEIQGKPVDPNEEKPFPILGAFFLGITALGVGYSGGVVGNKLTKEALGAVDNIYGDKACSVYHALNKKHGYNL